MDKPRLSLFETLDNREPHLVRRLAEKMKPCSKKGMFPIVILRVAKKEGVD